MHSFRSLCLAFAFCAAPLAAVAQSNITIDMPLTLEYQLRMSIAPGTQQVYCYQQDRLVVVGSVNVPAGSTATVPISIPDPVIRCSACNSYGCSSLSPNAAVVVAADPLDRDQNGLIDVRDIVMCSREINWEIFGN